MSNKAITYIFETMWIACRHQELVFLLLVLLTVGSTVASSPATTPNNNSHHIYLKAAIDRLVSSSRSSDQSQDEEAKCWRQLGKIQLNAGEYAEARRIFCEGAKRCPFDDGLVHHERVFNAFHGSHAEDTPKEPAPLMRPSDPNIFLSLDVPTEAEIPKSVQNWKGKVPQSARKRLIHATKEPVLPKDACKFLIQAALDAATNGWTTDRHVQAPTCDIPVFDLAPQAREWCRNAFHSVLFPLLSSTVSPELDIEPENLRIQDCFIVRYDGEKDKPGFNQLRPHEDESLLSLTIALNDMSEYEGGGLFIQATGDLLNGDAGTVLCFPGSLVHGGYPVSAGTRWILTVFIYVDANESGQAPGYTLDMITAQIDTK